jgi:hypothetical protein
MRRPAALFPIVLSLGAIVLAPWATAQAQDAGKEGPREIEKCQTINEPGSYKLVKNLTFTGTSGVCLSITADFVSIDLAGFTMTGNNSPNNTAPIEASQAGVAVRNGSISGFSTGVDGASIVEGLRVSGSKPFVANGFGIIASGIVRNNIVTGFAGPAGSNATGISATGVVTGNVVVAGRPNGFEIGEGSTVIGNTVTGALVGFSVSCPSNLTDNTAVSNAMNIVLNGDGCNNTNNVAP